MAILCAYSDKFQPWGFDEAFLDVSSQVQDFDAATQLAVSVKHAILWHERLTCSIGIAPNKLVAKIASDFTKPDGLTVVPDDTMETFLAPLPVRKMLWIGGKTERKLNQMRIKTIGDLAECDVSILVEKFGVMGRRFHQWAHGTYFSEVGARKGRRKSLGHESTFAANTDDPALILTRIDDMCQRIHERMVKHGVLFQTVVVKIRFGDFQTFTSGKTLHFSTNRLPELQKTAHALLKDHLATPRKVRLVGVRVSNLKSGKGQGRLNT